MRLDISKVGFSKHDLKTNIKIPKYLTPKLAYLIGVHIGDGSMNAYKRSDGNSIEYYISYCGHIIDEKDFHQTIIRKAFETLFSKEVKTIFDRRENHSSIKTYFRSKAIFTFFNKVIGIPAGSKENCDIPKIIKESDAIIKRSFLKGLADTDFSLVFKKRYRKRHYYPAINFSSKSKYLTRAVKIFLNELGFTSSISYNIRSRRNEKVHTAHYIDIYGKKNLSLWFKEIGFNSTKHLTKYQIWKKFGFCPMNTNIIERRKILKGEIDVNSYYRGPIA